MAVPAHLTIKTDGLQFESLFAAWQWLVKETYTPVVMTALGDVFLRDNSGRIHFLDLMCGEINQIAVTETEFNELFESKEHRKSWFVGNLVMELRKIYGDLKPSQCFSCKIPMSLGGQLEASNFEPRNIQVHYSILGQLHQQTRHLAAGTIINDIRIEGLPN